jgi:hypothetical protein
VNKRESLFIHAYFIYVCIYTYKCDEYNNSQFDLAYDIQKRLKYAGEVAGSGCHAKKHGDSIWQSLFQV